MEKISKLSREVSYYCQKRNYIDDQLIVQKEQELREEIEIALPQKIRLLYEKHNLSKKKKEELEKIFLFIYFIGEVYPCLFPRLNDRIGRFVKKWKYTFKLFDNHTDDEEKKENE